MEENNFDWFNDKAIDEYEYEVPLESESELQSPCADSTLQAIPNCQLDIPKLEFKCDSPICHSTADILEFVSNNPTSFLLIPTSERGILRLSRTIKRGYKCTMIQSLKDCLDYLNKKDILF